MKATSSIPAGSLLDRFLDSVRHEEPIRVPLQLAKSSGPVARKRFIHDLRENRHFNYEHDFIF